MDFPAGSDQSQKVFFLRHFLLLSQAGFPETVFPETGFPDTVFPETVITETVFSDTIFPKTIFPKTVFPETVFPETVFPESIFTETKLMSFCFWTILVSKDAKNKGKCMSFYRAGRGGR